MNTVFNLNQRKRKCTQLDFQISPYAHMTTATVTKLKLIKINLTVVTDIGHCSILHMACL